ncbi:cupin-like domain-containing protein [Burkholderia glumae]|uniref:cupin-like domain-containing protein n=1 Tax=Burkholderia glumae TaxID=337 RepID=UPI000F5F9845|nr:cupin-like domain-containing protein [Burkholderia glumae]MCQ0033460.1 cupin-like domain-containing protein [Burkholderia glumae]MCQ0036789.1 cupin-like domain-containing protein [Burkholderia glumae]QJW82166.1 cupin-like domain-containing protein [Burkholderia glumae]RQZ71918.1 cupin-like domain-containing protein [Burkholderia glumae]UVS84489.1 cupin-like domain-containing protein [Burkholderia glumae]
MSDRTIVPIARIRHDGKRSLREVMKGLDRPAVLQGFIDDWPALARWTPEFFVAQHGGHDITVETSSLCPTPTRPDLYLASRRYEKAPLGKTIREMQSQGAARTAYITYAEIYEAIPSLREDITLLHERYGFPRWLPDSLRRRLILRPGFWLGPEGISSPLHFDRHENLNVQVYGRKRWVLFGPGQSHQVYYRQRRDLPVIFSPVDMTRPDLDAFPRLGDAQRHDFVLEAGEVLYLPPGWWHFVTSLSDSINVNYWWWSPRALRTWARVELASLAQALARRFDRGTDATGKPTSMPR